MTMSDTPFTDSIATVRDLRRQWKPTRERLQRASSTHPLAIRMHRAFSWMTAVEDTNDHDNIDAKLVFRWIALNALYGKWNDQSSEPEPDRQSLRAFLETVLGLDREQLIAGCLSRHQALVVSICSDPFVNDHYWRLLNTDKRFNKKRDQFQIQRWYADQNWTLILDELIQRIYLVRCQLVHGAATFEGKLNRDVVRRCGSMLERLLFVILTIITKHGWSGNWDHLCYPPVGESTPSPKSNAPLRRSNPK